MTPPSIRFHRSTLLALPLFATMIACGSTPLATNPPAPMDPDAGALPADDAGHDESPDAGHADASGPAPDAGTPAPRDAGPPPVDAPIATIDLVTVGSIYVELGDPYDPATDHLGHAACTIALDPVMRPVRRTVSSAGLASPDAERLRGAIGGGSSKGVVAIDHDAAVADFLARAGATPTTASVVSTVAMEQGILGLSGHETPQPETSCGGPYVSGLDVGAAMVWGFAVDFAHGADRDAALAAYGSDVGAWFTRADAAAIGAALAPKATLTIRVMQVGGAGGSIASVVKDTRCSFAAMDECARTQKALRDYVDGFGTSLGPEPTTQVLGGWAIVGFRYTTPAAP